MCYMKIRCFLHGKNSVEHSRAVPLQILPGNTEEALHKHAFGTVQLGKKGDLLCAISVVHTDCMLVLVI